MSTPKNDRKDNKSSFNIMVIPDTLRNTAIELAKRRKYKTLDDADWNTIEADADWDTIEADAMEYLEKSGTKNFTRDECIKALAKAIKKPLY